MTMGLRSLQHVSCRRTTTTRRTVSYVWIAAEGDNFNKIIVSLGLYHEATSERSKLIRLNPHLPICAKAKANTPLKAGTRVNLTLKAKQDMMPDPAVEGESGLSLGKEKFSEPAMMNQLFSPKDYESCEDRRVQEVYDVLSGTKKAYGEQIFDEA